MLFALLAAVLPHTASAEYVISVYVQNTSCSKQFKMLGHDDGTQTIVFPLPLLSSSCSSSVSDYVYWIGNGGWEEGKSLANQAFSLSSVSTGYVKASISSSSTASNYGPTFTVVEPNYYISVYKSGSQETANFTSNGDGTYTATININGFSGNLSDYTYWIGIDNGWDPNYSSNVNLGSSLSNCTTGSFTVTINPASDATNYSPTFSCIEAGGDGCSRPADGSVIPAGTYVFFDNTSGIFTDNAYVAVSSSAHAAVANFDDNYAPNQDKWYPMEKVSGTNYFMAYIEEASPTSRLSFWDTNMSGYNQIFQAKGFYNLAFSSTSATMFVPSSGSDTSDGTKWCHNSNRQTYYSTLGAWAAGPVAATATVSTDYVPEGTTEFTLTGNVANISYPATYQWQYSIDLKNWVNLDGASGSLSSGQSRFTYTVKEAQFHNYYRFVVTYGGTSTVTSNELTIIYDAACGAEFSEVEIYVMDFGTTTVGYTGYEQYPYTYRRAIENTASYYEYRYDFKNFPLSLNDGCAAIVADPYWCGSGVGYNNNEELYPDVTDGDDKLDWGQRNTCETENINHGCPNWFRGYLTDGTTKFRDHTINQQSDGSGLTYGLCLFINYAVNGDDVAFIHQLTPSEQNKMVPGSILTMEAYAASPAKAYSGESVDMEIRLQYCASADTATWSNWETIATSGVQTIKHDDNWKRLRTNSFALDDRTGYYRLLVIGTAAKATGNDVVIDNIKLIACKPRVEAYFVNEDGTESYEKTMTGIDKEYEIEIPAVPSSMFGDNPDVAIFLYDQETKKYTYVGMAGTKTGSSELTKHLTVGSTYTNTSGATVNYFSTIPDEVNFVAIATTANNMSNIISSIESGQTDPENDANCARSETILTYRIACPSEADVMRFAAGDTTICYSTTIDYPQLNLEFQHVTNDVQFQLTQNNNAIGSFTTITAEQLTAGKVLIDLADYATQLGWVAGGEYEIGANIQEIYNNQTVCSRATTQSVKIEIVPVPDPQLAVEQSVAKCQYQADVKIAVVEAQSQGYTYGYQWQQSVDDGQTFSDISGATSYEYLLPAEASDKTQYRVAMTQTDATAGEGGTTCGPVYSDVVTLTVNDCSELELAQAASVSSLCDGDEITITWTLKNTSQYDNQVKAQVSSSAMPEEFTYVSSTTVSGSGVTGSYDATNRVATMDVSSMARESSVVVAFTYKYTLSTGTLPRTETLQAYVSQKNETTYASYAEQATETMKAASDVTFLAKTTTPITVVSHEECALSTGTYKFADLMAPGSTYTNLKWYDADGNVITSETFSLATPGEYKYYVTDTAADQCESDKAEVTVIIHDNTEPLTVSNYNECPADGTLLLADQITSAAGSYTELVWYAADGETVLGDATYSVDKSVTGTTNYHVQAKLNDECPSNLVPLRVNIKDRAIESDISVTDQDLCAGHSATLSASTIISDNNIVFSWYADAELTNRIGTGQSINITVPSVATTYYVTVQGDNTCENLPGDGAELSVTIRPAVTSVTLDPESETIGIGSGTTKTMTVNPSGAAYEHVWTVNDVQVEAATSYTERPYADRRYRVTVSDECDNVYEADATTTVVWPTIITPHNYDGINDDFLTNLGGDIDLVIYDRYGNEVFRGTDGWPTVDAATHLPGIYFYVATLPGGEVKKGTIEIYRTN